MGCNTGERSSHWQDRSGRRHKRKQRYKDDLLFHLGLTDLGGDWSDVTYDKDEDGNVRTSRARIEQLEGQVSAMSETITALAERIKVLERIVVDEDSRLAREIDGLKDK